MNIKKNLKPPPRIPDDRFIWVFPKIGVPQNGWSIMEIPIKMDDLGGKPTIFGNILIGMPYIGGTISSHTSIMLMKSKRSNAYHRGPIFPGPWWDQGPGGRWSWRARCCGCLGKFFFIVEKNHEMGVSV